MTIIYIIGSLILGAFSWPILIVVGLIELFMGAIGAQPSKPIQDE